MGHAMSVWWCGGSGVGHVGLFVCVVVVWVPSRARIKGKEMDDWRWSEPRYKEGDKYQMIDDCNIKIVKYRYGEMEGIPLHFALKFSDYKWDLRGVLNFLWMYDIFFWRLPFLKSIIFANILVWLLLIKG